MEPFLMPRKQLSLAEARRVALAAQGFDKQRPGKKPSKQHFRRVINQLGLLQLDFVNVLVPAHYFVMFSRLGSFQREKFDQFVYQGREFIEHWAHEASIVPVECWPLLEYRRKEFKPWPSSPIMKIKGKKQYLETALDRVENSGPIVSGDLPALAAPKGKPGDWVRSVPRWALEVHFGHGAVSVAGRLPNFQRQYDLPERLIDEPHFSSSVSREDGQRQLLETAAAAHGIGTMHDLADYFRMSMRDAAPRLLELVEEGILYPLRVEGWNDTAYLHHKARIPRTINASSLLSPFDPVVWFRPRAERLFAFHYRIEIYVPAAKRKYGYYVLPYLQGDRIVARVDLKADRKNSCLNVLASYLEEGADEHQSAAGLAIELRCLADWLGLTEIKIANKGGLAKSLKWAVRANI
jgi:uncharacterized protein YcaQ